MNLQTVVTYMMVYANPTQTSITITDDFCRATFRLYYSDLDRENLVDRLGDIRLAGSYLKIDDTISSTEYDMTITWDY